MNANTDGRLLLFPGQGAQVVGMARRAVSHSKIAALFFDDASEAMGIDLRDLCWTSSLETLTDTKNAQITLTAAAIADWLAAKQAGQLPPPYAGDAAAGHSVGALPAAVASGFLTPVDAMRLAFARGSLMAQAPSGGSMLAVAYSGPQGDSATLKQWALTVAQSHNVDVGAINGPRQVVFSGGRRELEVLADTLDSASKFLTVSNAFHSRYMASADAPWRDQVESIPMSPGECIYVCCTTGHTTQDPSEVRADLIRGMTYPVLWSAVMEQTVAWASICVFGPGTAVARLARPYLGGRAVRIFGGGR